MILPYPCKPPSDTFAQQSGVLGSFREDVARAGHTAKQAEGVLLTRALASMRQELLQDAELVYVCAEPRLHKLGH